MDLGWLETFAVFSGALTAFVWARDVERRPVDLTRPRMIPTLPIMALSVIIAMLMLAHFITLVTGQPFTGGTGFRS